MDPRLAARRRTVAETRIRAGIRRLLMLVVVVGVAAVTTAVLRSPLFSLDRIEVAGEAQTDPVSMIEAAGVVLGIPLIEIDTDAAVEALAADPRIASVDVGRRWPTGLEITVVERFGVAWVDTGGGWQYLAPDGVVLAQGDPGPVAPRIRGSVGGDRAVEAALLFVDALPEQLTAGMVIDARTDQLNAVWGGFKIRLGRPTDMEEKARALEVVIADQPEPGSEITLIAPDRPAVLPPTTSDE
ncbi:MAG: FtsQ-type POTRA domain-containing protein [Acidimicrobiia bacterium]